MTTRAPRAGALSKERVGTQLQAMRVPEAVQFDVASALLNFLLGLAAQHAAAARSVARGTDRSSFLMATAARWSQLDPAEHPFVRQLAARLPAHDDRAQFLAGIDPILAGVDSLRTAGR